jgi:hypothetical protein
MVVMNWFPRSSGNIFSNAGFPPLLVLAQRTNNIFRRATGGSGHPLAQVLAERDLCPPCSKSPGLRRRTHAGTSAVGHVREQRPQGPAHLWPLAPWTNMPASVRSHAGGASPPQKLALQIKRLMLDLQGQ